MFKQKSPVKKKFNKTAAPKKYRKAMDPRTRLIIRQVLIGIAVVAVLFLLGTGVWYGTRLSSLTIVRVEVSGGETIDHVQVEKLVQETLTGDYAHLVPRRFAWWYPEQEILAKLRTIPRLKDPQLTRTSGTELAITFSEYKPYALWCTRHEDGDCLFLDNEGYAFTPAPQLSGGAFSRFITIGVEPSVGTTAMPVADFKIIEQLSHDIGEKLKLPISYIETDLARDYFLGIAGGGELKGSLRYTPEETFNNLATILASPKFKNLKPGSFEYIDLRFGDKVFVNKDGAPIATSSASTSFEKAIAPLSTSTATATR